MKPDYIPDTNPFTRLVAVGISEQEQTILFILNDGRAIPFPYDEETVDPEEEWHRALRVDRHAESYVSWESHSKDYLTVISQPDYRVLQMSKIFD